MEYHWEMFRDGHWNWLVFGHGNGHLRKNGLRSTKRHCHIIWILYDKKAGTVSAFSVDLDYIAMNFGASQAIFSEVAITVAKNQQISMSISKHFPMILHWYWLFFLLNWSSLTIEVLAAIFSLVNVLSQNMFSFWPKREKTKPQNWGRRTRSCLPVTHSLRLQRGDWGRFFSSLVLSSSPFTRSRRAKCFDKL